MQYTLMSMPHPKVDLTLKKNIRRGGRNVNGILLLDKPIGLTSNGALQEVKSLYKARKAGHTGSLDPIATGLLPICFGEATKISSFFLDADKRYTTVFKLGESTDTGDAEGEIISTAPVDEVADESIDEVLATFRGRIQQVPPMYSAIKHRGQPLYKLARQGIEVERKPRVVNVYEASWRRLDTVNIEVELHCSSGFYVRTLAHEMGEKLGCGAHVASLRRIGVGPFSIDNAESLEQIRRAQNMEELDRLLIPADEGLSDLPDVMLSTDAAYYLCRGQPVRTSSAPASGWVRLYAKEAGFLGVGQVLADGRVAPKRLFHTY